MNVALRPQHLDILSICTGGGGLDLGIGLALEGARSVCMVEREAFAVAQLVSAMRQGLLHPAPVWSDARTFDGRRWRGCVDGLIGGIPCQPHSLAGKREGSDDERDLWSDARRIIVQSRPWFVLIENVEGMLSAKPGLDPGALRVRRDLQRLGFDIAGGLFTAAEVGASHDRERVFILGVSGVGLADAFLERSERSAERNAYRAEGRNVAEPRDGRRSGVRGGKALAHTHISVGECASRQRHDSGNGATAGGQRPHGEPSGSGCSLVHADGSRSLPAALAGICSRQEGARPRHGEPERPGVAVADDHCGGQPRVRIDHGGQSDEGRVQSGDEPDGRNPYLFPPGPSDRENWQAALERAPELEPAFRRVADGLASRLDVARVDRLRMLGNGVVPLQAAYAFRTLATRLAGRGSAGAARLVRMMEAGQ